MHRGRRGGGNRARLGSPSTSTTDLGWIDLLGEIAGGGTFEQLMSHTVEMRLFGHPFRVLSLPRLIHVKRAAGRPKDLEAIAELEALLAEADS